MRKLILALILWPSLALAEGLPKPASTTVNDWAEVISPAVEARLATTLADARRETGVHVVVVTMKDQADFGGAGQSIETYATNLFNAWGVGDRNRNDGVLILVTPGRRAMRIELGTGFGGNWDETAKGIIDDTFLPAFAEGQIEAGIRRGTGQVLDRIARPFAKGEKPSWNFSVTTLAFAIFGAIAVIVTALMAETPIRDFIAGFRPCPQCGTRKLSRSREIQVHPTGSSQGQGMVHTLCGNCGFSDHQSYGIGRVFSRSDDSDNTTNSGFGGGGTGGGFDGGSSSGGGGSGRW